MRTVRQGDILFIQRESTPTGATPVLSGVIARGSATGHTHALRLNGAGQLLQSGKTLYVIAAQSASIDHQEHATVMLEPGTWEIRRQREETPEGFRQVED